MAGINRRYSFPGEPMNVRRRGEGKVTVNRSRSRAVYSLEKLLLHFHSSDQCLSLAGIVVALNQAVKQIGKGEERRGEEGPNRASDKRDK